MVRFGLIGLGGIGAVRKIALSKSPNACLTAAFDLDRSTMDNLDKSVNTFRSCEELLRSDACDAVILSTPTQFHQDLAILAMEHGKHVIVEKPMASTLEGARLMLEAAKHTGKILTIGFNHRYFSAIKEVRNAIHSGAIGPVRYIKGFAGHTGLSEFKSKWMYDKDIMGGGALMDNGIHVLDLVCHLMGEVNSVSGMISTDIWKLDRSEDNAFVHLQANSGVLGSLHASWSEWKGYHFYVEAYGDKGMARAYYAPMTSTIISFDRQGNKPKTRRNFYLSSILREKIYGWQSTVVQTFVDELDDFVNLSKGGAAGCIAQASDGYRAVEIANAVYASHVEKRTINLDGYVTP